MTAGAEGCEARSSWLSVPHSARIEVDLGGSIEVVHSLDPEKNRRSDCDCIFGRLTELESETERLKHHASVTCIGCVDHLSALCAHCHSRPSQRSRNTAQGSRGSSRSYVQQEQGVRGPKEGGVKWSPDPGAMSDVWYCMVST